MTRYRRWEPNRHASPPLPPEVGLRPQPRSRTPSPGLRRPGCLSGSLGVRWCCGLLPARESFRATSDSHSTCSRSPARSYAPARVVAVRGLEPRPRCASSIRSAIGARQPFRAVGALLTDSLWEVAPRPCDASSQQLPVKRAAPRSRTEPAGVQDRRRTLRHGVRVPGLEPGLNGPKPLALTLTRHPRDRASWRRRIGTRYGMR